MKKSSNEFFPSEEFQELWEFFFDEPAPYDLYNFLRPFLKRLSMELYSYASELDDLYYAYYEEPCELVEEIQSDLLDLEKQLILLDKLFSEYAYRPRFFRKIKKLRVRYDNVINFSEMTYVKFSARVIRLKYIEEETVSSLFPCKIYTTKLKKDFIRNRKILMN